MLTLVQKRVDAKDPVAMEFVARAYCDGDYGLACRKIILGQSNCGRKRHVWAT